MGSASGGQNLTPNPNVLARAGYGGDVWGANGGGATPYGTATQVGATMSNGQRQANFLPGGNFGTTTQRSVMGRLSNGEVSENQFDSTIQTGGSNNAG
jgi:hypothetical protein